MSAWMVPDEVTSCIAQAMVEGLPNLQVVGEPFKAEQKELSGPSAEAVAMRLFMMNRDAIVARYAKQPMKGFTFVQHVGTIDPRWLFKQVHCLQYQCSEGNVPKTKLYKALKQYGYDLAETIVYNLPGENLIPWGDMKARE